MMYNLVLVLSLFTSHVCTNNANKAAHYAEHLFGLQGVRVGFRHQTEFAELMLLLLNASSYEKKQIAKQVASMLDKTIKQKNALLEQNSSENNAMVLYNIFILTRQRDHLVEQAKLITKDLSLSASFFGSIIQSVQRLYTKIISLFGFSYQTNIDRTAHALQKYCTYEREYILSNYFKTLYLLAGHNSIEVPLFMRFWDQPHHHTTLLLHAKKLAIPPHIQAEIADIAAAGEIAGEGAGIATELGTAALSVAGIGADGLEVGTDMADVAENSGAGMEKGFEEAEEAAGSSPGLDDDSPGGQEGGEGDGGEDGGDDDDDGGKKKPKTKKERKLEKLRKLARKNTLKLLKRFNPEATMDDVDLLQQQLGTDDLKTFEQLDSAVAKTEGPIRRLLRAYHRLKFWQRFIVDMGLQMSIIQGGTLANFWTSQIEAKKYLALAKKQSLITQKLQETFGRIEAKQTIKRNALYKDFQATSANLERTQTSLSNLLSLTKQYLLQSIVLDYPIRYYFADPIIKDLYFAYGRMYTPSNLLYPAHSHRWYNVYRFGNWQFDPEQNSFIQTRAIPFASEKLPEGVAIQGLANSIATEYFPPPEQISQYTIQIECSLHEYVFPFFMGIMFNIGRWVSGASDRFFQHRLFGIYGTKEKEIVVSFGETVFLNKKYILQVPNNTIFPLELIAESKSPGPQVANEQQTQKNRLYLLSATEKAQVVAPKSFLIQITTQPENVTLSIAFGTAQDKNPPFYGPVTIGTKEKPLNAFMFLFHGIGFMSAGCATTFKIIQPTSLVYTPQELSAHKKTLHSSYPVREAS